MFRGPRRLPGPFLFSQAIKTFHLDIDKKPYLRKKYSTRSLTVLISQDDSSDPLMHSR